MGTSLLDLVGVLLIGLVGALSVTTVQSLPPPPAVSTVADALQLSDVSDQTLVVIFALAAAAVLLTKSILSSYLTRRVFGFLANRQALVSARLAKELLSRPLIFIQRRSSQETSYALITGVGSATSQILGHMVIAATEVALLAVLAIALLILSPWIALGSIAFFALIGIGLQRAMGGWASRVGTVAAEADIASLNAVQEAMSAYREITVTDRRALYVDRIQDLRWQAARVMADTQFIGMLPKYIFEAALVVGGFALAAILFTTQESVVAVGTLALFLAAGARVMPSLLRLQGSVLSLRGAAGAASPTFELASALGNPLDVPERSPDGMLIKERIRRGNPDFNPTVEVCKVSVYYEGAPVPALDNVSLAIGAGQSAAIVGPSGAGKSTLADVILGVVEPDRGTALLGGHAPQRSISLWPGGVAYVPQDVVLANDSIRCNVALGLPAEAIDDEMVWKALERAHIADYLKSQRDGLDTPIGERGIHLSGGQRQRLGIARALYTRPRLLVLDEATSALDAETEHAITQMISELEGDVTTLVIAHRLSTVRSVDILVYMNEGKLLSQGSFAEVMVAVPSFERQARLMGLA